MINLPAHQSASVTFVCGKEDGGSVQQVEDETGQSIPLTSLLWDDVFHTRYRQERPWHSHMGA